MTRWVVKEEFVPITGSRDRSDRELAEVAAKIRALFVDQEGAANGSDDRFVVSAKVDAEDARKAESWGRSVLYGQVTDLLDDWRLERINTWPA